jgi:hypothetical protein
MARNSKRLLGFRFVHEFSMNAGLLPGMCATSIAPDKRASPHWDSAQIPRTAAARGHSSRNGGGARYEPPRSVRAERLERADA